MNTEPGTQAAWGPVGPASRRRRIWPWVVAAIALVVVLGGGAYVAAGVGIAVSDRTAAERVVDQVRQDNDKVASLVKAPDLQADVSGNTDINKLRADIGGYRARITAAKATLAADMPRLDQAASKLRSDSGSFLLMPQRGSLDHERNRLEALAAAFRSADQALGVADQQLQFVDSLLATSALFSQVGDKLNADDPAGALALYGQVDPAMQQLAELAKNPHIPQQLQTLANTFATTAADVKKLVQAGQAKDANTANALTIRLQADEKALNGYDEKAAQAQATQILQPYVTRYETAMKEAGIKVVSG